MKDFILKTAWTMEKPQAYGSFHLTFTVVGLIVVIVLAFLLRKLNEKQNRVLMFVIGFFLIITELYKQLFYFYVMGNNKYMWWIFPFQLCSVPMYLCIICAFCKSEKFNSWLYNCMFSFNFFGGIITFIEPSGINHPYLTLTLHAYIWHMCLIFIGFYLFFSKRVCNKPKEYFKGLLTFLSTVGIAQTLNIIFKNRAGFNMFYISPYTASPLAVFKDIYLNYGWVANFALYLFGIILASIFVYYSFYLIRYLFNKKKNPN